MIPGSQAGFNGPYVSSVTFPFFTTDHASVDALLAGSGNILDYPPDFADLQTALSTQYVNVTAGVGTNFEQLMFNMYTPADPGYYLGFRQAIAQVVNYTYIQSTVLEGVEGLVSQNWFIPSAFGAWTTNNINNYQTDFAAATTGLQKAAAEGLPITYDATGHPSAAQTGTGFFCTSSQTGVWKYQNGTDFSPKFYTRIDHPTWLDSSNNIAKNAAQIGLCLDVIPVNHFSSILPIVFTDFSNNWAMYFGGNGYSAPLNPVSSLYFSFSQAGIDLGPYLGNTYHFYNSTMNAQLVQLFHETDTAKAQQLSQTIVQELSYQIPSIMMWWDVTNIPSLNNHGGTYWSGYVDVPLYGAWSFGTGYWTLLNAHMVNPSTGAATAGGHFVVNMHETPDDYNFLYAGSVYDFDVINSILFDTPMVVNPGNVNQMIPWMLTNNPQFASTTGGNQYNVSMTTPHGEHLVNGMVLDLEFMHNITWTDNMPFTAADYNFSLWYSGLPGNQGPYAHNDGNGNNYYYDLLPALVDSQVTGTYSMKMYLNATDYTTWLYSVTAPLMPEHLWSTLTTAAFNNDPNVITQKANGALLMTGPGAFYVSQYVASQYVTVNRYAGYFRTNIHAWQVPAVQAGNSEPLSFAITQQGTPIPSSAKVTAYATLNGHQVASAPLTLNSNGNWTGSFSTSGWSAGFYEVAVNGTYTDSYSQAHEAMQYYGMTVTSAAPPPSSSTTPPPSSSTTPASSTTPPPSSSTSAADYTYYYVAAAVIIIIIIAGVAAYSSRRRKP